MSSLSCVFCCICWLHKLWVVHDTSNRLSQPSNALLFTRLMCCLCGKDILQLFDTFYPLLPEVTRNAAGNHSKNTKDKRFCLDQLGCNYQHKRQIRNSETSETLVSVRHNLPPEERRFPSSQLVLYSPFFPWFHSTFFSALTSDCWWLELSKHDFSVRFLV